MNLCPAVCDAVRDKLRITGFHRNADRVGRNAGNLARTTAEHENAPQPDVDHIWHRNRMQLRAGEIHREALVSGDAFAIVWPDDEGKAAIYPNRAVNVSVTYDEDRPGRIIRAAKFWRTADKHTRLNLFYHDRIERYITAKPGEATLPDHRDFVPFSDGNAGTSARMNTNAEELRAGSPRSGVIPNPYGIVPVFHFANNADLGAFGRSELESAIPVQDGLNKSVLDMLVAMEYSAYRQRWASGIEIDLDNDGNLIPPFKAGVDHLWVTQNPEARFGDFGTANLDQFLKVKDSFRIDMASVTGTPMYYLLPHTRGFPSGEAILRAESRFIARSAIGSSRWSNVDEIMQFAPE